ncbi:odorant receptor Or1-like [Ptiloglossa arizonensis]|uniref:odorant receptor Or1-like n=1 Tax=Ptiloglossa arizonensis TaxID=3350558 RepID=UPI003F9F1177
MRILRWEFMLLNLCGCSRPFSWTSPPKKFLYNTYTVFLFFVTQLFLLTLILDLVFNVDNQDDFSDNFYFTLEIIACSWKLYSISKNQGHYAIMVRTLEEEPLAPINIDEIEIQLAAVLSKPKNSVPLLNAIAYTSSLVVCATSMIATPILTDFTGRKLCCRAWLPYDYTAPLIFIVTYIYQAISISICALLNVAGDCLFSGLLIHTYCLFEILGSRLKNIANDKNVSAKHNLTISKQSIHLFNIYTARVINSYYIFKDKTSEKICLVGLLLHGYKFNSLFATTVSEEFKSIIFIQFLVSTAILCVELYRLTRRKLDSRFVDTIIYGSCSLLQILFYCWYGNESLNITDMIIESNWAFLDNGSKKILLMIMKRATVPIEFRSIYIASMNLASFMALLKASYSAYNVLQQGQE